MHPYYGRTDLWLNWLAVIIWWILPLMLIKWKSLEISNYVLYKLIELIILIQFIVTPLSYDDVIDKVCDIDYLLLLNHTNSNKCSEIPSKLFNNLNCDNTMIGLTTTASGFLSGLSLYFAYTIFRDVKSGYHKLFIILQILSMGYWMYFYHILLDPTGPCYSKTSSINIARIMVVFTPFIIIFSIKANLLAHQDQELDDVTKARRNSLVD